MFYVDWQVTKSMRTRFNSPILIGSALIPSRYAGAGDPGLVSPDLLTWRSPGPVRYGSASAIPEADDVRPDDYAADVRSWVVAVRTHARVFDLAERAADPDPCSRLNSAPLPAIAPVFMLKPFSTLKTAL